MANVKELYAKISATAEGFNKTMDSISNKTRQTAKSISSQSSLMSKSLSGVGKAGQHFDNLGSKMQNASKSIGGVGQKMTNSITKPAGIAVGAVGGLVGALGFKRLVGMDNAEAKLKGIGLAGKDVTKVQNQVSKSIEGSMTTMAEGTDLAAGALGSGVKQGKDLEKYIKAAGNAAVGANVPVSEMGQIFSRVKGQGKLAGTELQMMEERLPGFTSTMAKEMGLSMEEFRDKVSAGEVGYDEFLKGVEARAGKSAEAQSQTFMGMLTNTKNYLGMIGEAFLQPAFKEAKVVLADLVDTLNSDELRQSAANMGKVVAPAFGFLARAITGVIKAFLGLPGPVLGAIGALGGILVVIGPVLTGIAKLTGMIGGMFKTFGSLLTFVSALNPVGLIIMGIVAAVIALGTAFYIAYQKSETFRNFINGIGSMISGAIGWIKQFGQAIGALFGGNQKEGTSILEKLGFNENQIATITSIVNSIKSIFANLGAVLAVTFQEIKSGWNGVINLFRASSGFFSMVFQNIVTLLRPLFMMLVNLVKTVFTTIVGVIKGALQMVQGVIQVFSGLVQGDWRLVWQGVVNILKGIITILWSLVRGLFTGIIQIIMGVGQMLWATVRVVFGTMKNIIVGIFRLIKWIVVGIFKGIVNAVVVSAQTMWLRVTQIFNALKIAIVAIWNGIKFVTLAVWNGIKWAVVNAARLIKTMALAQFRILKNVATTIWNGMKAIAIAVWNAMKNRIIAIVRVLKTIVLATFRALKNVALAIFRTFKAVAIAVWNALKNRVIATVRVMKNIVLAVFRALKNAALAVFRALKNVAISIWNALKNRVIAIARTMKNVALAVFRAMKNAILAIWKALKNVTISIWNAIKNRIIAVARGIKNTTLSVFRALKSGITGIWNAIKSVTSSVWNAIKNIAIKAARALKNSVVGIFKAMGSSLKKQVNHIKSVVDGMVSGVKKGLNALIKGVNWVGGKLGVDKKIPTLSTGTAKGAPKGLVKNGVIRRPTLATVNDKGRGNGSGRNGHQELIRRKNGSMFAPKGKDVTVPLGKGDSVINGKSTQKLLPNFSTGTGEPVKDMLKKARKAGRKKHDHPNVDAGEMMSGVGGSSKAAEAFNFVKGAASGVSKGAKKSYNKLSSGAKSMLNEGKEKLGEAGAWAKEKAGDLMDYIGHPGKLLDKILKEFGVDFSMVKGDIPKNLWGAMWKQLKEAAKSLIGGWLDDASEGEGDGRFIKYLDRISTPYSPNGPPKGYPFSWAHPGIDLPYINEKVQTPLEGRIKTGEMPGGFGHYLRVMAKPYDAYFGHLSKWLVKDGQHVKPGDTIAITGSTGASTGPHLHYEMNKHGHPANTGHSIDPVKWLKSHNGSGKVGGSGSGNARKAIKKAQAILGGRYNSSYITEQMMRVAKRESNFQADAVNNWDVNARAGTPSKGMFQMIGPTFKAFAKSGYGNIMNPVHQAISAMRYIVSRYGWGGFKRAGDYAYANGGIINSPELAWLAEGGFSESVISHDPRQRTRSKAIHDKTGKMLGVDNDTELLQEIINILEAGNNLQSVNNNAVNRLLGKDNNVYLDGKKLTQEVNRKSADMYNSSLYNQGV